MTLTTRRLLKVAAAVAAWVQGDEVGREKTWGRQEGEEIVVADASSHLMMPNGQSQDALSDVARAEAFYVTEA